MIKEDMNAFRIPEPRQPPPATAKAPQRAPLRARPPVPPQPLPRLPERPVSARPANPPVLQVLRTRLGTIAGVFILGMLLGVFVMLQFTPVYKATAVMAVTPTGDDVGQRVATLRSWALAEKVILKLNLTRDPEVNTALTNRSLYRVSTWFDAPRQSRDIVVPPGEKALAVKPALLAAFSERLDVQRTGPAAIRITFQSEDPVKAARIANAVAAQLPLEQPPSMAGAASGPTAELSQLGEQLRRSQDALDQYRAVIAQAATAQPRRTAAIDPQGEAKLAVARRQLAALEARHRKLMTVLRRGSGIDTVAALVSVPELEALRLQQADLARREQDLAATFGTSHPETLALQQERRSLDLRIDAAIRGAADAMGADVAAARRALATLEQQVQAAPVRGVAEPVDAQRLASLEAQVREDRVRYETMLARTLVPGETVDAAASAIRITQQATPPESPVFPNRPMTLGLSFLGSAMLAFGVALSRGPAQGGLRRAAEIERAAKVSNLAMVPERPRPGRVADGVIEDPLGAVTTSLRSLHATVSDAMEHAGVGVLALTSAGQGAGTTSLAISLARIAAREAIKDGGRVLLLDADFRRADMAGHFAEPSALSRATIEDGLVEVLSGECDLSHAIRRDRLSPLEYLPIAAVSANPANLLSTQSMRRLVETLRQHYALVVINTPCVRDFPDACSLAGVADTFLLVVGWDETQAGTLADSVKRLRDAGASVSGTVINRCGRRHAPVAGTLAGQA